MGLADQFARAGQGRADGCAQPLGETDRDRVEPRGPLSRGDARGDHRVEQSGAVEVHRQPLLACPRGDLGDALKRIKASAATVMTLFERDQTGPCVVAVDGPDLVAEPIDRQDSARGVDRARSHAPEPRDSPAFPHVHVRGALAEQLVTRRAVDPHADLVGHGAGGNEQRGLLAQDRGDPLFEGPDRRVLAIDIVPDLGLGHGPTHRRGGPGHRVGPQVDDALGHRGRASRVGGGVQEGSCVVTVCTEEIASALCPIAAMKSGVKR